MGAASRQLELASGNTLRLPVGEATELPETFGWLLWNMAVEQQRGQLEQQGVVHGLSPVEWTLEPMR